jgi:nitroimidazol reductase NimA-like FMN-containing flavoprotein (pyridoxamine 5'-phosphate oxidase superfamily)
MSAEERETFLAQPRIAICAITRDADRPPHLSPLWYEYEETGLKIIVESGSEKQGLLKVGGHVTLCIQDETPPYAYVTVEGRVAEIREASYEEHLGLAHRYLPQKRAEAYMQTIGTRSKNFRVHIQPLRWLSFRYRTPPSPE